MKVKDIVSEAWHGASGKLKDFGTTRGEIDPALPNARIEPRVRNTDTYMQSRYGVALAAAAAAQDPEFQQETVWAENFGMVAYSDKELDVIKKADKLMGVNSVGLTGKSQERKDINSTSPVANSNWRKPAK